MNIPFEFVSSHLESNRAICRRRHTLAVGESDLRLVLFLKVGKEKASCEVL
jgi:hypothetical protein